MNYRLCALLCTLLTSWAATYAGTYRLTVLDPASDYNLAEIGARAMNNHGVLVGVGKHEDYYGAFSWDGATSTMLDLNYPGYRNPRSYATGINDSGDIVGSYLDDSSTSRSCLWRNGSRFNLNSPTNIESWADDINSSGHVVGGYTFNSYGFAVSNGIVWHPDGSYTVLKSGGGDGTSCGARVINDTGIAAGSYRSYGQWVASYWLPNQSTPVKIQGLQSNYNSQVNAINNQGDMLGSYFDSNYYGKGCFAIINNAITSIGTSGLTSLIDINNNRQVLGATRVDANSDLRYFIWSADNGIQYIDTILGLPTSGTTYSLIALNDAGQIAADVRYNGSYHVGLLNPVPEPASMFALSSGLLVLALKRKRK